jgi:hypothetical protein
MNYVNFDLEASDYKEKNGKATFNLRVSSSPHGEMQKSAKRTIELDKMNARIVQLNNRQLTKKEMIAFGKQLTEILFPHEALKLFELSRAHLGSTKGLRIRLKINDVMLKRLPWEFIYLPRVSGEEGVAGFLANDRSVSIVRHEPIGIPPGALGGSGKLRVVALIAQPVSSKYPKLKGLDREQANLQKLFNEDELKAVSFNLQNNANIDKLEEAIENGAEIFHFAGHGVVNESEEMSYLVLQNESGDGDIEFGADKLAANLQSRKIKLAVFTSCQTADLSAGQAWSSIAPALTRVGIPAVVGMQFDIDDENAVAFCRRFYGALVDGRSLDEAMTEGRLAIFNRSTDDERDWGVPVLYLRLDGEDSTLFPRANEAVGSGSIEQPAHQVPPAQIIQHITNINTGGGMVVQGDVTTGGDFVGRDNASNTQAPSSGSSSSTSRTKVKPKLPSEITEPAPDKMTLRTFLINNFNSAELEELCFSIMGELERLGKPEKVDLDTIGGSSKPIQVLNLIGWMERRGWYDILWRCARAAKFDAPV